MSNGSCRGLCNAMSCAGGMLFKNIKEPLDGAPFVAGCLTILRQFHSNHIEECVALFGQFVRSMVDAQQTGK